MIIGALKVAISTCEPRDENEVLAKAYKLPIETLLKLQEVIVAQDIKDKEFVIHEEQVDTINKTCY